MISAAHFGAAVIGTEINYQIARAVGRILSLFSLFMIQDIVEKLCGVPYFLYCHFYLLEGQVLSIYVPFLSLF